MNSQKQTRIIRLIDRSLLRITGVDSFSFLQNLVTNDMRLVQGAPDALLYSCLLSPQGQILHDFFIFSDGASGFYIDCDSGQKEALIQRLNLYKLRTKVDIQHANEFFVFYDLDPALNNLCFADPRLTDLGYRVYSKEMLSQDTSGYDDFCISYGVPIASAMKLGKDYISDLNLDLLNAVSFEKGCFVGQELTARVHHRGLVKRRLFIINGNELSAGEKDFGDVRITNTLKTQGLALLKVAEADSNSQIVKPFYF